MLKKIYLGVLGLSILIMAFFTYYSWSWLQSIGSPITAVEGFEFHSNIRWIILWITSVAILMLGNGVLWSTRSSWGLWTAFLYFTVFVLLGSFWLDRAAFEFKKVNGFLNSDFTVRPLFGVILVAAVGVLVFIDQFIAVRLLDKMYPPITSPETAKYTDIIRE